jgi:hypothetical protein
MIASHKIKDTSLILSGVPFISKFPRLSQKGSFLIVGLFKKVRHYIWLSLFLLF